MAAAKPNGSHRAHRARTDPFRAFRSWNYRAYAAGFLFGSTGLQMLATAVQWDLWERTQDPLWLGYSGLARALPVMLLALPAGHRADVVDRRSMLIVTQVLFAAAGLIFALSAIFETPPWCLLALLVLTGMIRAFAGPTRASLLPLLVSRSQFENAVTWSSGIFHTAAVVGPMVASLLIAWVGGPTIVYLATAVCCGIFALSGIPLRPRAAPRAPAGISLKAMFSGLGYIVREKTILGALTLDLLAVLLGGATALLPIFAEEILDAGPIAFGALRAATPLGAILMALLLTLRPRLTPAGPLLFASVFVYGLCMIGFGLSTNLILSMVILVVSGAADNISVVVRHVLVQTRTPNHIRGRVSAVNGVFIECSNELGAFESGLVARLFSPVVAVVSGGIGTLFVVAITARAFPALRRLQDLREVTPLVESETTPVGSATAR